MEKSNAFTLSVDMDGDGDEYGRTWTVFQISGNGAECYLYLPDGVSMEEFTARMRAAVDVLNGEDAHDLVTVHRIATAEREAELEHARAFCWEIWGREDDKRQRMVCELADALGLDWREWAGPGGWPRMLERVRAASTGDAFMGGE